MDLNHPDPLGEQLRGGERPAPPPLVPRPPSRGLSPEMLGEAVDSIAGITDAMTGAIRSTLSGLKGRDEAGATSAAAAARRRYETHGEDRDALYLL